MFTQSEFTLLIEVISIGYVIAIDMPSRIFKFVCFFY